MDVRVEFITGLDIDLGQAVIFQQGIELADDQLNSF